MLTDIETGSAEGEASDSEASAVVKDQAVSNVEKPGEAEQGQEAEEAADLEEGDDSEDDQPEGEDAAEVIETVKIEYDGVEYDVPKDIKDAVMREKDYTHKTQTLGDERRAFEDEQKNFRQYVEATQAHSEKMANLAAIDQQIEAFRNYDWNAAFDADITEATKLQHQAQQLNDTRNTLVQDIQGAEAERAKLHNEQIARTAQRTDEQMKSEIPGWGSELKAELGKFGVEKLGFPADAVARAVTPQEIKALYYAQVGFKTLNAAKAKVAKAKEPEKAKPSKGIKPKRQKAPVDLSKISDPEAYRKAYLARKRKQG